MRPPCLGWHIAAAIGLSPLVALGVGALLSLAHPPVLLGLVSGIVAGYINGALCMMSYRRRLRRYHRLAAKQVFEFTCETCGRHIVRVASRPHEPPVCADCLHMPGWINDPFLVGILDPEGALGSWENAKEQGARAMGRPICGKRVNGGPCLHDPGHAGECDELPF